MATPLEEIILCNDMPEDCICVSRQFVRHPNGFAAGALIKNINTGEYFIFTGKRAATVPRKYAEKYVESFRDYLHNKG